MPVPDTFTPLIYFLLGTLIVLLGFSKSRQITSSDLALTYHLSRDPIAYRMNTLNAIVARELAGRGVKLQPGESIRYIITEYAARTPSDRARASESWDGAWGYDVTRYTDLVMRAIETITQPLGVDARALRAALVTELPSARIRTRLSAPTSLASFGPLFEFALRTSRARQ